VRRTEIKIALREYPATRLFYRQRLPHWEKFGCPIFDTLHLHGALPQEVVIALRNERNTLLRSHTPEQVVRTQFARVEKYLDAYCEVRYLDDARAAYAVTRVLMEGVRRKDYVLSSFVVMPSHIHYLFSPQGKQNLKTIRTAVKRLTSRAINGVHKRSGRVWMGEGFDHWIRDAQEYESVLHYIEANPVKARLVASPEQWPWSSACPQVLAELKHLNGLILE
jgi:REP element-mobilizing transposase RayT